MIPQSVQQDDWQELLRQRPGKHVSLFMPTHRAGVEVQQDPVRLKNLLREAAQSLEAAGLEAREVAELLAPAEETQVDPLSWTPRSDGLAVFCGPGVSHCFALPFAPPEKVVIGDRFAVKPLTPLFLGGGRYYVLALSLHEVRLLEASRDEVRRVELRGVPTSFEDALGHLEYDPSLKAHTTGPGGLGRGKGMFHGHGDADAERLKKDVLHYFQQVAKGLPDNLQDREAPIVLATVEEHFGLFREANHHLQLLDQWVQGSPDRSSDLELRDKAWEVVEPWFLRERDEALERFVELRGADRSTSVVEEVVASAHQGRVDTLLLAPDAERWGRFDPETGKVEPHAEHDQGTEDLLDLAAFHTLGHGGKVYPLAAEQIPDEALAAAVLRY
jgi:hypothetical protein